MKLTLWILLLVITLAVVDLLPTVSSKIYSNLGFILLNKDVSDTFLRPQDVSPSYFTYASELDKHNESALRGDAISLFKKNQYDDAIVKWIDMDITFDELLQMSIRNYHDAQPGEALKWLKLAERFETNDETLWQLIGKTCQRLREQDAICQQFVQNNQGNWLVNPRFDFEQDGWQKQTNEGTVHRTEICPEQVQHKCAHISVDTQLPQPSISWHQCMNGLIPNQKYKFFTWIKVVAAPETQWRSVYFQGRIDGQSKGFWPGTQVGSTEWAYWEQAFVMPDFENEFACFHPVRMMGEGDVWFHTPTLIKVEP